MLAYTRELLIDNLNQLSMYQREFNRSGVLEPMDNWFNELEESLSRMRNPLSTSITNSQTKLQVVISGLRKDGIDESLTLRKAKKIGISMTLVELAEILTAEVVSIDEKFEIMGDKLAQLIAGASSISPLPAYTGNMKKWRNDVWKKLGNHDTTKAMYVYLTTSLAKADRDHILETMLIRFKEEME